MTETLDTLASRDDNKVRGVVQALDDMRVDVNQVKSLLLVAKTDSKRPWMARGCSMWLSLEIDHARRILEIDRNLALRS